MKDINLEGWVKGLQEAGQRVGQTQDEVMKKCAIAHLLGYVESSKYLI